MSNIFVAVSVTQWICTKVSLRSLEGAFTTKLMKDLRVSDTISQPRGLHGHVTFVVRMLLSQLPFSFSLVVSFQCFYPLMYSPTPYYLLFAMYKACFCRTSLPPIWFRIGRVSLLLGWGSGCLGWKFPMVLWQHSGEIFTHGPAV